VKKVKFGGNGGATATNSIFLDILMDVQLLIAIIYHIISVNKVCYHCAAQESKNGKVSF